MTSTPEDLSLAGDFPPVDHQQWVDSVMSVLDRRGALSPEERQARYDATLTTTLEDGIRLSPLYTSESTAAAGTDLNGLPGHWPFRRGAAPAAATEGWEVRQRVPWLGSAGRTAEAISEELEQGASAIWLDMLGSDVDVETLDEALADVDLSTVPLTLSGSSLEVPLAGALHELWERRGVDVGSTSGCLGLDPYGLAASRGGAEDIDADLGAAVRIARTLLAAGSSTRALVVDATLYHDAGASAAEELALALATGVAYLRDLVEGGLTVDEAAGQIEFRYAATDVQFPTIAKLRSARVLWARVCEVAGVSEAVAGQRQHAVTSAAMLTRYDPWVNVLRGTVACFAAGIGGATAVTVLPHDDDTDGRLASDLGRRLARNTQTVLLAESHLGHVVDPAGGSWFVESLTDALSDAAWTYFQEIERHGGLYPSLQSGAVQARIQGTSEQRLTRVSRRTMPITGVSEFPLADDSPLPPGVAPVEAEAAPEPSFARLAPARYAEPFEDLRDRAAALSSTSGRPPQVFLATLGSIAEHTARARFVSNLFAAGGVTAIDPGPTAADRLGEAFAASGADIACICGNDEANASVAADVARALAEHSPARLYLAGSPGTARDDLDAAGVDEYVVAGGDALDLLTRALDAVEAHR